MGILSLFRTTRRKDGAKDASDKTPAPAQRSEDHGQKPKGAEPAFAGLASHSVIVRPVVTEKATILASQGRYAFHITGNATKTEVRRAVEQLFKVHVTDVKIIALPAKTRRRGNIVGSVAGSRKAVVTLKDGERIDLSSSVPFEREHVDHAHA